MTRGHSVSCADAVRTTPAECRCACAGDFHGGPHTERVRALVWDPGLRASYSRAQVARAKKKARDALATNAAAEEACTDFAVTHMIDVFIAGTQAAEQQIARETLKTVLEPFVTEIVNADLDEAESRNIETAVNNLHILCTLCVEILKLVDQVQSLANDAADMVAQSVANGLDQRTFLTTAVKAVLKSALTHSCEAVIALVADPVKIDMLRMVGFVTCPNIKAHPDVEKYCVAPLENEYVTAALQYWIDQNFPSDSALLQRAPRRAERAAS